MTYLGDYAEDFASLNLKFTTRNRLAVPTTLAGTPVISVYKASGTTQSTAGITLVADFDSVTGLNNVLIDLSADAFYATGADYHVVITTGTVNSISVVGEVVAEFSIENRHTATIVNDWTNGGRLDTLLDAIPTTAMRGTNDAMLAANGALEATVAALNDIAVADIWARTLTEPSAATIPPASTVATAEDALRYIFFALTNRVDSDSVAGFLEFFNRAGTVVHWKKAVTDVSSIASEATGEAGP